MRRASWLLLFSVLIAHPVVAQQRPDAPVSAPPLATSPPAIDHVLGDGASEWMVSGGPAWGVKLFHSIGDHDYVLQAVSWGRVLTEPHGPGVLRGRFEIGFEVVPVFAQYAPYNTYGFGLTPILWRWNFESQRKFAAYAELAGGGLWTGEDLPKETTSANFTAHASYGMRFFLSPQRTINVAYRFHHISNGNRRERNPGINAHAVMVGVSLIQPRR